MGVPLDITFGGYTNHCQHLWLDVPEMLIPRGRSTRGRVLVLNRDALSNVLTWGARRPDFKPPVTRLDYVGHRSQICGKGCLGNQPFLLRAGNTFQSVIGLTSKQHRESRGFTQKNKEKTKQEQTEKQTRKPKTNKKEKQKINKTN